MPTKAPAHKPTKTTKPVSDELATEIYEALSRMLVELKKISKKLAAEGSTS
jgi:hypothetical protein